MSITNEKDVNIKAIHIWASSLGVYHMLLKWRSESDRSIIDWILMVFLESLNAQWDSQARERLCSRKGPDIPINKIQSVQRAHNFELLQQAFWLRYSLLINSQWEIILVTRRKYAENHSSLRLQSNHPTVGILWWSFKDDNKVIKDRTFISMFCWNQSSVHSLIFYSDFIENSYKSMNF